jgi:hypothetical protein
MTRVTAMTMFRLTILEAHNRSRKKDVTGQKRGGERGDKKIRQTFP